MVKLFSKIITGVLILGTMLSVFAATPVEQHGWLKTQGCYLLNKNGNIVQLKGMSFFWSRSDWYQGTSIGSFYSKSMVDFLVDQWKCTVLRLAYATDAGNYQGLNYVEDVAKAAIDKGVYVIIDWHAHDAHLHEADAINFFKEQAAKYLNTPNVIFEVFNEPKWAGTAKAEDGSVDNARITWKAIKPYLTNVTKAIRETGSKNLIILGTPYFCQHPGVVAADPVLNGSQPFENVAYAFHFYAASHGPNAYYVKNGSGTGGMEPTYLEAGWDRIPVFVTEWGTSHSDGGLEFKEIDPTNTQWWITNYLDSKYHLSSCNWSVSNWQASSAFAGGSTTNPSPSGQIVKAYLTNGKPTEFIPPWITGLEGPSKDTVFNVPKTHAAKSFNRFIGAHAETTLVKYSDRDNVDGRVDIVKNSSIKITPATDENWIRYNFKASKTIEFLTLRYLAKAGAGEIEVLVDEEVKGKITIPMKDTAWITTKLAIKFPSGTHELKFRFLNTSGTNYFIEWIELTDIDPTGISNISKSKAFNTNARISMAKDGFDIFLPFSNNFSSYSLIGVDGRVIQNGAVDKITNRIRFTDLSKGIWFCKLNGIDGDKIYKAIVK